MVQTRERTRFRGTELLEARRLLAVSSAGWDGAGRGSSDLTYYLANVPANLDRATVANALATAMQAWSDVIDVEFTATDRPNQLQSIDISFATIDGSGGTLAQAYLPADVNPGRLAGDIQFDSAERWEVGNAQANAFDLVLVAVHELGHALGLEHSAVANSVMADRVAATDSFRRLATADVDAALSRYAAAILDPAQDPAGSGGTPQPGKTEVTTPNASETTTPTRNTPAQDPAPTVPNSRRAPTWSVAFFWTPGQPFGWRRVPDRSWSLSWWFGATRGGSESTTSGTSTDAARTHAASPGSGSHGWHLAGGSRMSV